MVTFSCALYSESSIFLLIFYVQTTMQRSCSSHECASVLFMFHTQTAVPMSCGSHECASVLFMFHTQTAVPMSCGSHECASVLFVYHALRNQALCPPICLFLSMAVAPSSKLSPRSMAFFPNRFLMASTASCMRLSFFCCLSFSCASFSSAS